MPAVEIMRKPVRVTWIRNILQPVNSKSEYVIPFLGNGSLADYIPADVKVTDQTVLRQNGHYIPQAQWPSRPVTPGDDIYIGCVPGGIGAAIIGSAAVIGTAKATVLGVAAAIAIEIALSASLSFLASLLMDQPDAPDPAESSTYRGGGRITTRSQHGAVVPIVYGEHIVGGNVIASYTGHVGGKPVARGNYSTSLTGARHNVVLGLCEGPIQAIGGMTTDSTHYFDSTSNVSKSVCGPNSTCLSLLSQTKTSSQALHHAAGNQVLGIRNDLHATKWTPSYCIKTVRVAMRRVGAIAAGKKVACGLQLGSPPYGHGSPDEPSGQYISDIIEVDPATIPIAWKEITFSLDDPIVVDVSGGTNDLWAILTADYDYASGYIEVALCSLGAGYADIGGLYIWGGAWAYSNYSAVCSFSSSARPFQAANGLIKVNGSPVESHAQRGFLTTRRGTLWQETLPNTSKASLEIIIEQEMPRSDTHWIEQSTQNEVDGLGIVIRFPQGFFHTNSRGTRVSSTLGLNIRWRVNGTGEWLGSLYAKETLRSLTPDVLIIRIPFPTEQNHQYHQFRGSKLDVAVQRTTEHEQTVEWASLQEYNDDQAQTYPYTALLQLDTDIGTSQGSIDSITTRIQGKQVHQYDTNGWLSYGYSALPAWCALDYLLNPRYGGGSKNTLANVDMDSIVAWADYCDESIPNGDGGYMNRWEIGLVLDAEKAFGDWAKQIAACGRAKLIKSGSIIRAKVEKAEDPSQQFTQGNVIAGSFRLQYIGAGKRPNAVDVKFLDADLDFAENIATAEDRSMRADGAPDIRETVELFGCTHLLRAKRHAKYLLNVAKYTGWIAEFDTFIDAIACEPGDVISIAADAVNWEAVGGRLKENAPGVNEVKLDRDLVVDDSGDIYKITVRTTVANQDALLTANVIEPPGTYVAGSTIDISPSWTTTPQAGDIYSVMPIRTDADTRHGTGAKLARIVETSITDDYFVHVKCVQYDERVYHDDPGIVPVPPKVEPLDGRIIPPPVTNLALRSQYIGAANAISIVATWAKTAWPYKYECEVWGRMYGAGYGDRYHVIGKTDGIYMAIPNIVEGHVYEVAICPCAPWTTAHRNPDIETKKQIYVRGNYPPGRDMDITGLYFS